MWITQADLVYWQSVYDNLWLDDTTWRMITVISSIYVKYDWENLTKVKIEDLEEKPKSREFYQENQPKNNPFCTITWQKIILYPTPKVDVINWLEIIWSKDVWEITSSTTTNDIFNWVLKDYQDLIIKWAEQFVYKYLQQLDKEQKVRNEFLYVDLPKLKAEISYRWSQPVHYEENPELIKFLIN